MNNKNAFSDKLLYGVAYYDEYMPYDRLDEDIRMMKAANINVVRIAESTWSTLEPRDGEFNFYHIDRVLKAMDEAGIAVIVGTPTYAIPPWMAKKYDDILIESSDGTPDGHKYYGARQIMDITHPGYLFHCERVIRKLMERVAQHPCVIGYQLDNETKHYGTACARVQERFAEHLKEKFNGDIEALNYEFGFNYWSNRVDNWEELPDVRGTINMSYKGEFEKFRRGLVTEFLTWQSELVREYKRDDQFITQNFDFEWIGYSGGVQPDVDHFEAAKCLTKSGCDIYFPSQNRLTGREIAFCGSLNYCLKHDNFLVLETEAQGFFDWIPYEGQLRLQAFALMASGADGVMYWHWHSLHNGCESYWRGMLSHDLKENDTYRECMTIGRDFAKFNDRLVHMKKNNEVAIMVNNESLDATREFTYPDGTTYNQVVHWVFDSLYELNVECDFIPANADYETIRGYKMVLTPGLYAVSKETIANLRKYVEEGGYLVSTFRTAYSNDNFKIYFDTIPYSLNECFGVYYQHFSGPENAKVRLINREGGCGKGCDNDGAACGDVRTIMEFLNPIDPSADGFEVLGEYFNTTRTKYIAAAKNNFGKGTAAYIGCMTDEDTIRAFLADRVKEAGLWTEKQESNSWPVINRSNINMKDENVNFYFNFSSGEAEACHWAEAGEELLSGEPVAKGEKMKIEPWGFKIVVSK